MSASFENETIDKTDKQYSTGTKKLNQNSKHVERITFKIIIKNCIKIIYIHKI